MNINSLRQKAEKKGIILSSTFNLYKKMAQGEVNGFTVPAFNIRTLTFDVARALFKAVKKEKVGAFIIELARSEINYTKQTPEEYVALILAAALAEKFKGPLFFQADHFYLDSNLKKLIKRVIKAGFYNIDLDFSKLKLKENFSQTAEFTKYIRKIQPKNLEISIGGEVGEIGGKNTTLKELKEFMNGCGKGLIKVAVQTGTSHGGILLASGKLKDPKQDFKTLKLLSQEAKKYGLTGIVQHGASTLVEKYFKKFPKISVIEIHLATIFQNIIYDSIYFPKDLKEKIYLWLENKFKKEKNKFKSEIQFFYKFRKYGFGKFKKEIWDISQINKNKICQQLEKKFISFFRNLNVSNTLDLIRKIY